MQSPITSNKNVGSGRQEQLQFIRFLAFANIFMLHANAWNFFRYPDWNGAVSAVSLFFMLSGVLTGYNAFGREQAPTLRAIGRSMWKKVKKLYPLYFLTLFYAALSSGIPRMLVDRDYASLAEPGVQLLKNILLLQSWFPEGYFSYNGVGWFLSSVMFLYLFNLPGAFVLNRLHRSRHSRKILAGTFTGILLLTVLYSYLTRNGDLHFLQYIFPPARMGEYFAGMILGFVIRAERENLPGGEKKLLFTVLEAASILFWFVSLFATGNGWTDRVVLWLLPNLLVLGIFTVGKGKLSELFRCRPLVRLGDISFECFLIHTQLIQLYTTVTGVTGTSGMDCVVSLTLCLTFTVLTAMQLNKGALPQRTGQD